MDVAYVDKLATHNNSVKYHLVCPDLFDRTVDPKGMKTKDFKKIVRALRKLINPTKIESPGKRNLLDRLKNYATQKENSFFHNELD